MKTYLTPATAALGSLAFAVTASAQLLLSVVPGSTTINVGDSTTVDLVLSYLPTTAVPFPAAVTGVGAFQLALGYGAYVGEPNYVAATGVTFPGVPNSKLDLGVSGSIQSFDLAYLGHAGLVEADETSLEDPGALRQAQYVNVDPNTLTASFTLASLTFKGLKPGTADIHWTYADLSDAAGGALGLVDTLFGLGTLNLAGADGTITVVPEPAAYAGLAGLGLLGFVWVRRSRQA